MEYNITHNKDQKRFELEIDGMLCHIDYELKDTDILFTHTYVPVSLEGKGIASALTRHALDFAHHHRFTVVPLCSFVKAYMKRHSTE
ncbi:MAG: GNAT family N-acetyltransferase [Halodesulfovibrio sp.]